MKIRDLFKAKLGQASGTPLAATRVSREDGGTRGKSPEVSFEDALSLHQQGQLEKAIEVYGILIDRDPNRAELYYKRANARNGLSNLEAALADYDRAIALNPSYGYALCNRGSVLERLGRREEALASFERALALEPTDSLTHYNRGSVLKDLRRFEEALESYNAALALNATFAEASVNRGNVLQELLRHQEAVESFSHAIALNPSLPEAFLGRGVSLHAMKRVDQALLDYSRAIELRPAAGLYLNRGNLLCELQRYDAAAADYSKVIELDPNDAEGHHGLASVSVRLNQLDRAIASFDRAAALAPSRHYLLGARRLAMMQACRWQGLSKDIEAIAEGVGARNPVCHPLTLASLIDSSALQRRAAEIWIREQVSGSPQKEADQKAITDFHGAPVIVGSSSRIRLGYFSADLRAHPVGFLTAGLFEHHDRSRFEVTAFAFGPEAVDPMRARLQKAFDRYVDVRAQSEVEVAKMAREFGIDIAIDLNGFSESCRTKIFALRAAPIQINFLGYPGTMGANFIDYLIADGTVVPRAQQAHYVEKILYLPGSFLPFDSTYAIADRTFSREELGLPPEGVVFCCFNNSYKILPDVFDRWMRILQGVEGSVLWLSRASTEMCTNLRAEAARRGIDGQRLVFAERMPSLPEHLARLRVADLFLDTFPYNAHATALDSLWAGVPLLTYPGDSFASRVASSLLRTAGVPELIARSPEDYERTARELALNPARLGELRRRLAQRDTPLFDTERYTRNLEAVYRAVYERFQSGEAPAHLNEHLADDSSGL